MCSGSCYILSQYGAEKHQRNSISVLVELVCTLDSRLFSGGASRILVRALHATRLGSWIFARLFGLKTLCSSVVSMMTSADGRPEAFLTNCHAYSTCCHWILVTFRFGLTVHQSDGASKHTFCRLHRKMELCNYHSGQHGGWDCFLMDC